MKTIYYFLLCALFVSINAQVKFKVGSLGKPEELEAFGPPDLYSQLSFKDDNGNGILENRESGIVTVKIMNKGKGKAKNIKVSVVEEAATPDPALIIEKPKIVETLLPKKDVTLSFRIYATKNIKSGEKKFKITGLEEEQYDMEESYLVLNTEEFQRPKLQFLGAEIIETGDARLYAKRNDGLLQAGELVKVKMVVQNVGLSEAMNVDFTARTTSENIKLADNASNIGNIKSGEVKEIYFLVSPTNRFTETGNLPVYLTLQDQPKDAVVQDYQLPIELNQKPAEAKIVAIEGRPTERKQVARFQYTGTKTTVLADNYVDIEDVPPAKSVRRNAVAVVIGVENYKNTTAAPYAAKDADVMKDYFQKRLGIPKENIFLFKDDKVSGFFFDDTFNPETGMLAQKVTAGETDVFVFYSGHGVPDESEQQTYLFPYDGKIERLKSQGYNLVKFYENLNKLNAKSVTVIVDACYSGASRESGKYIAENITGAKAGTLKIKLPNPWIAYPNFTVINSSSENETSQGYDDSETGLFTYYIAAGLKGKADANNDNKITLGELKDYVVKNVTTMSRKLKGKLQTPNFYGDDKKVLVEY